MAGDLHIFVLNQTYTFMRVLFFICIAFYGCGGIVENKINKEDYSSVKDLISKSDTLSEKKKKYLIAKMCLEIGLAEMGKLINKNIIDSLPTFKESIVNNGRNYDNRIKTNIMLKNFLTLDSSVGVAFNNEAMLFLFMKCKNNFKKKVLFVLLNYKYQDKYQTEHFNETAKIIDRAADNFNAGKVGIQINDKYGNLYSYMHSYGSKFPDGLKINVSKVVFDDNEEIIYDEEIEKL